MNKKTISVRIVPKVGAGINATSNLHGFIEQHTTLREIVTRDAVQNILLHLEQAKAKAVDAEFENGKWRLTATFIEGSISGEGTCFAAAYENLAQTHHNWGRN